MIPSGVEKHLKFELLLQLLLLEKVLLLQHRKSVADRENRKKMERNTPEVFPRFIDDAADSSSNSCSSTWRTGSWRSEGTSHLLLLQQLLLLRHCGV